MLNPVFTVTATPPVSVGAGSQTGGNPVSVTLPATPAPVPVETVEPQSMTQSMVRLSGLLVGGDPRTGDILAGLAMLFARNLNVQRLEGETAELFGRRLAAIILDMKPADRATVQRNSVLRNFGISAQSFAAALNNPNSAVAARVVALTEAPHQSDRQFAARAAEQSYADDGSADHHTNDVLRFRAPQSDKDMRQGDGGKAGLPKADALPEEHLQEQLKARFSQDAEPAQGRRTERAAIAMPLPVQTDNPDTRVEIAEAPQTDEAAQAAEMVQSVEAAEVAEDPQQPVAAARADRPHTEPEQSSAGPQTRPVIDAKPVPARNELETPARTRITADTVAETSVPSAKADTTQTTPVLRRDTPAQEDHRVQTLMVFKGLTEVISTLVDKTTDTLKSLMESDPAVPKLQTQTTAEPVDVPEHPQTASAIDTEDQTPDGAADKAALLAAAFSDETDEAIFDPRLALARHPEPEVEMRQEPASLPQQPKTADGVPFAIIPYPPGRNLTARKAADLRRQAPFGDDEGEEDGDPEAADERRERKAAPQMPIAIDDKPFEADTPLSRRPTDAERAFHMYQRMGGF